MEPFTVEELETINASGEVRHWTNCVCVTVSPDLLADIESGEKEVTSGVAQTLAVIPGRYMKTSVLNEKAVFRQEPSAGVNDRELFLSWHVNGNNSGWYIAGGLDVVKKSNKSHDLSDEIYAWLPGDDIPDDTKVHIPYWASKALNGVMVQTSVEYTVDICSQLDSLIAEQQTTIEELQSETDGLRAILDSQPPDPDAASHKSWKERGWEKPKKNNAYKKPQTSGWFNRTKLLLEAHLRNDAAAVQLYVDDFIQRKDMHDVLEKRRKAREAGKPVDDWED